MAEKKIKVSIRGQIFNLPINVLQTDTNGKKYIYLNQKDTATIIKQFIKKLDHTLSVWVNSSTYANGCSVNAYVSNPDGSPVPEVLFQQIEDFAYSFQMGDFDGITDSYNYGEDGVSDNGTQLDYGAKYVFVENKPKFDTVEYVLKSISEGNTPDDAVKYMSDLIKVKIGAMYPK